MESNAKILIVEDEFVVAANLEACIEDWGHRSIGIAPDLETALRLAGEQPDLALVDVHLRDGMTGPLIASALRARNVPVIFVTANPRMVEASGSSAIGVLTKPCDEELVAASIEYALGRARGIPMLSPPSGLTLFSHAA